MKLERLKPVCGSASAARPPPPTSPSSAARVSWPGLLIPWLRTRPPGRTSWIEPVEVDVQLAQADMFEHADRRDGVEWLIVDVAVVLQPYGGLAGQAPFGDGLGRPFLLLGRDGDPEGVDRRSARPPA